MIIAALKLHMMVCNLHTHTHLSRREAKPDLMSSAMSETLSGCAFKYLLDKSFNLPTNNTTSTGVTI
eukprot:6283267-Amphidinium_carterae.1